MARYIDAEDFAERMLKQWDTADEEKRIDIVAVIANIVTPILVGTPTADVVEVVHTSWETELDDMGWNKHTCPNCGFMKRTDIHISLEWNYCPNCGAKMERRWSK